MICITSAILTGSKITTAISGFMRVVQIIKKIKRYQVYNIAFQNVYASINNYRLIKFTFSPSVTE